MLKFQFIFVRKTLYKLNRFQFAIGLVIFNNINIIYIKYVIFLFKNYKINIRIIENGIFIIYHILLQIFYKLLINYRF